MRHIEVESIGYYGLVTHSILEDGDTILSFEDGVFKLYDKSYLKGRKVLKVTNVPKLDLKHYEGYKIEREVNCFEAIEHLYKLNGIKMTTGRVKYYILFGIWSLICILGGIRYGVQLPEYKQVAIMEFTNEGLFKYIID